MRYQGTIVEWNDARGFGFVVPNGGGERAFLHISALQQTQRRPRVDDEVVYELDNDAQGRARAINARMLAAARSGRADEGRALRGAHRRSGFGLIGRGVVVVILIAGAIMYWRGNDLTLATMNRADPRPSPSRSLSAPQSSFSCQGKTRCPQMGSCAEARFYQDNCPNTQMDGDGDGIPCESQWCAN